MSAVAKTILTSSVLYCLIAMPVSLMRQQANPCVNTRLRNEEREKQTIRFKFCIILVANYFPVEIVLIFFVWVLAICSTISVTRTNSKVNDIPKATIPANSAASASLKPAAVFGGSSLAVPIHKEVVRNCCPEAVWSLFICNKIGKLSLPLEGQSGSIHPGQVGKCHDEMWGCWGEMWQPELPNSFVSLGRVPNL